MDIPHPTNLNIPIKEMLFWIWWEREIFVILSAVYKEDNTKVCQVLAAEQQGGKAVEEREQQYEER